MLIRFVVICYNCLSLLFFVVLISLDLRVVFDFPFLCIVRIGFPLFSCVIIGNSQSSVVFLIVFIVYFGKPNAVH